MERGDSIDVLYLDLAKALNAVSTRRIDQSIRIAMCTWNDCGCVKYKYKYKCKASPQGRSSRHQREVAPVDRGLPDGPKTACEGGQLLV